MFDIRGKSVKVVASLVKLVNYEAVVKCWYISLDKLYGKLLKTDICKGLRGP